MTNDPPERVHAARGSNEVQSLHAHLRDVAALLAISAHDLGVALEHWSESVDVPAASLQPVPGYGQSRARVRAGSLHLQELIESILSFARIDAGKVHVRRAQVDLSSLVHETVALIEPLARARNLDLVVHTPADPLLASTDAAKVRQIILNLLSNAVKFTDHGSITLDLRRDAGDIVLSVTDTGIGIPPEEQARIFEPFRQVGDVYTQKSTGTGLGLKRVA